MSCRAWPSSYLTLIVGLALLTWAATDVVQTTAREWFERDVSSRAQLVLIGASQSLANSWYGDPAEIQKQLMDLARDERVIGAAACNADLTSRFSTPGFPGRIRVCGGWAPGSYCRCHRGRHGPPAGMEHRRNFAHRPRPRQRHAYHVSRTRIWASQSWCTT